ncbi:hypothetical protein [Bacillus niameyensis]|uniref:hypothetical protein n=1 Tax=Bacillus niameyensis TaxID=1522308 RepID=UPI00078168E6|nr:hypothetical protein [Bacillus niameyensis]
MRQAIPIQTAIVIGLGASAAMWLSSKTNRIKLQCSLKDLKRKFIPSPYKSKSLPVTKGGHPHPTDIEDNKMVDEGAMYSVQFFNENVQ